MGAPLAEDVVQVPLSHDHELVETLVLQTLNEPLKMGPQIWREGRVSLDLRPADDGAMTNSGSPRGRAHLSTTGRFRTHRPVHKKGAYDL
ncbi:hypothetical protein [Thalassoglobus sp.]|uniref:hypothetical protein n=1 Tax=Thalassoglobus sp. TaxID=2795869 RepID=UPI003AA910A7